MGKKDDDNNNGGAPAAPAVNTRADEVLAAMLSGRVKLGRKVLEKKPLNADQVAKICAGRLALYRRRVAGFGGQGTPGDALRRVLALNAADVGLSVPEYKEQFAQVLVDSGVVL